MINKKAGLELTDIIKKTENSIPILIQSYEKYIKDLKTYANKVLDKNSSLFLKDLQLKAYAGCGIVADSEAEKEVEELTWKLMPLLKALE